jgi:hypothetical protein
MTVPPFGMVALDLVAQPRQADCRGWHRTDPLGAPKTILMNQPSSVGTAEQYDTHFYCRDN